MPWSLLVLSEIVTQTKYAKLCILKIKNNTIVERQKDTDHSFQAVDILM